jgi:hypothetical protein
MYNYTHEINICTMLFDTERVVLGNPIAYLEVHE